MTRLALHQRPRMGVWFLNICWQLSGPVFGLRVDVVAESFRRRRGLRDRRRCADAHVCARQPPEPRHLPHHGPREYRRKRDFTKLRSHRRRSQKKSASCFLRAETLASHRTTTCVSNTTASCCRGRSRGRRSTRNGGWRCVEAPIAWRIRRRHRGYGAGIVMLWDKGARTPQADDVDAALKKATSSSHLAATS